MSVGEQVFDLFIGEDTVCLQAEHGQPALRVVAADDLTVELHTSRSALGTLAAGIPAGEQLVAREQFGGNFPRVRLYLLAEGIGRKFPALNACQLLFPFARHGNVGDAHRLHDRVEGKPLFGGYKRLLAAFHVSPFEKRFDNRCTGSRRADAAVLQSLTQCVVLNLLACRFHSGQQGGFGMQRFGLGLSLCDGGGFQCQRVAFLPAGEDGFLFLFLAIDSTPPGLFDDAAFCHELRSGTLRRNSGCVFDAFFRESLNHASGNHLIDDTVFFGEEQRFLARDEQGMVVCYLAAVHAAACRHCLQIDFFFPFGQITDEGE